MKIRVLFFASLRETIGTEALVLDVQEGSYAALRKSLIDQLGEAADALWLENVRVAHNQELVAQAAESLTLVDGDEVAFLPPVTGG